MRAEVRVVRLAAARWPVTAAAWALLGTGFGALAVGIAMAIWIGRLKDQIADTEALRVAEKERADKAEFGLNTVNDELRELRQRTDQDAALVDSHVRQCMEDLAKSAPPEVMGDRLKKLLARTKGASK